MPDAAARRPLDVELLRRRLVGLGLVSRLDVVESTRSTNADLLLAAAAGAPSGTVLAAEFQSAGRGRFDRVWTSPPRAGLAVSVLVRPAVPVAGWTWLPLLAGLAVRAAVADSVPSGLDADIRLKWPNDLLIGARRAKAAGILVQAVAPAGPAVAEQAVAEQAVVIGMGVNVDHTASELPGPEAGSVAGEFAVTPDRGDLLVALLSALDERYRRWADAGGDVDATGLRAEYERVCETLGREVEVTRASSVRRGRAIAIDDDGSLVVATPAGTEIVSAADIAHVRPASAASG